MMNIRFVYPDMTSGEFYETMDSLNHNIDVSNRLSSIPRLLTVLYAAVSYVITAVLLIFAWKLMIFLITGKDQATVYVGLLVSILLVPAAMSLQKKIPPLLKKALLKAFSLKDYEEKFTVSEYADRQDDVKKMSDDLKFYNLCDELRSHKIDDASVNFDGSFCEVDISYRDEDTGTDIIRKVKLPFITADTEDIVVNLERRCVVLPLSKGVDL